MTTKEKLCKSMEEYFNDSRMDWPDQMEDVCDLIDLEHEIGRELDDYEFTYFQVACIIELMFQEYCDHMDSKQLKVNIKNFIDHDLTRMVAEHLAKDKYIETYF